MHQLSPNLGMNEMWTESAVIFITNAASSTFFYEKKHTQLRNETSHKVSVNRVEWKIKFAILEIRWHAILLMTDDDTAVFTTI